MLGSKQGSETEFRALRVLRVAKRIAYLRERSWGWRPRIAWLRLCMPSPGGL